MSQVAQFKSLIPPQVFPHTVVVEVPIDEEGNTKTFTGEFQFMRASSAVIDEINAANVRLTHDGQADPAALKGHRHRVIAYTVLDANEPLSVEEVGSWPPEIVRAVFDIAARLNGLTKKAKDDAEKKSAAAGASGG